MNSKEEIVNLNRREFFVVSLGGSLVVVGCGGAPGSPTSAAPTANTTPLLVRVQSLGYASAQRVAFGSGGAARIAIEGSINWNFLIGDQTLAIGPDAPPTFDVSLIAIPQNANLVVRRF